MILPNGTVETKAVTSIAGNVFTVAVPFSTAPNANSIWIYETSNIQTSTWRVLAVEERDGAQYAITALSYNASKYDYIERDVPLAQRDITDLNLIPTTPATFTGDNTGAEIAVAPSGRFVYVSNRGHDSIVTFAVDAVDGTLTPIGWESTQGKKPRFFTLDPAGEKLYVCNEDSDTIVAFRLESRTGLPVRDSRPPSCMRHPGSAETSRSIPLSSTSCNFESAIATETSG